MSAATARLYSVQRRRRSDPVSISTALVPQMLSPLAHDSQADSILDRQRQTPYELSPRDRQAIRDVLRRSDIVESGDFEVPGTVAAAAA